MTRLIVRRPPFPIDASVPFQWQPANPSFGMFGNTFTFLAIAFERYIVAPTSADRQPPRQLVRRC